MRYLRPLLGRVDKQQQGNPRRAIAPEDAPEGAPWQTGDALIAEIGLYFMKAVLTMDSLGSVVLEASTRASRCNTMELRTQEVMRPSVSVKLPFSTHILLGMRTRLWDGKGWGLQEADLRLIFRWWRKVRRFI